MQHLDPESLSLLALGEELGDDAAEHLRSCAGCAAEYAGLRRAVVAAKPGHRTPPRSSRPGRRCGQEFTAPWGFPPQSPPTRLRSPTSSGSGAVPRRLGRQSPPGSVTPLPSREAGLPGSRDRSGGSGWLRRPGVWLAAAAATALLAAGVFWSVQQNQPVVTPLAQAELAPVDQHSATGSARVVEAKDGQRTLEVRVDKNEARGYQEVWLIAPDLTRLVSLGVMTSESGTFPVPAGWIWASTRSWTCPTSRSTAIPRTPA